MKTAVKHSKLYLVFTLLLLFGGICQGQSKKELKKQQKAKDFEATKTLVDGGVYEFNAEWANSAQGKRINLATTPNEVEVNEKSLKIYLPYYGVGQTASMALRSNTGLQYEGEPEYYKVEINEKKQEIEIKFQVKPPKEILDFTMTIYHSGGARVNVQSNIRTGIKYEGKIGPLDPTP